VTLAISDPHLRLKCELNILAPPAPGEIYITKREATRAVHFVLRHASGPMRAATEDGLCRSFREIACKVAQENWEEFSKEPFPWPVMDWEHTRDVLMLAGVQFTPIRKKRMRDNIAFALDCPMWPELNANVEDRFGHFAT
jgi:hypothetical protein